MHFHTPSENLINGERFPFEAHFVNISDDDKIVVLALLYNYSDNENPFITKVWEHMPKDIGTNNFDLLINEETYPLADGHYSYYEFTGSLTTPPCTEGVEWLVLKDQSYITKEQVQKFENTLKFNNNRPVQETYNREVFSED
jgi:carbonic anhydrase